MKPSSRSAPLVFSCVRCGACCREAGVVVFTGDDVERAAQTLGMTASAFAERYLESTWLGLVVTVTDQQPCIFLTEQGCRIQDGKPRQCATFPFWDELTNERGELVRIDRPCPGVRRATS